MISQYEVTEAKADRAISAANLAAWRKRLKISAALYDTLTEEIERFECARLIGEAYLQVKAAAATLKAAREVYRQALRFSRNPNA